MLTGRPSRRWTQIRMPNPFFHSEIWIFWMVFVDFIINIFF